MRSWDSEKDSILRCGRNRVNREDNIRRIKWIETTFEILGAKSDTIR